MVKLRVGDFGEIGKVIQSIPFIIGFKWKQLVFIRGRKIVELLRMETNWIWNLDRELERL
jgi:hypothetical protein